MPGLGGGRHPTFMDPRIRLAEASVATLPPGDASGGGAPVGRACETRPPPFEHSWGGDGAPARPHPAHGGPVTEVPLQAAGPGPPPGDGRRAGKEKKERKTGGWRSRSATPAGDAERPPPTLLSAKPPSPPIHPPPPLYASPARSPPTAHRRRPAPRDGLPTGGRRRTPSSPSTPPQPPLPRHRYGSFFTGMAASGAARPCP